MRLLKTYDKLNKFGIPLGYKRVEYLESTETQWIKTDYTLNPNTKIDILFSPNQQTRLNLWVIGSRVEENKLTGIRISSNTIIDCFINTTNSPHITGSNVGNKYRAVLDGKWTVNDTQGTSITPSAGLSPLTLFSYNSSTTENTYTSSALCACKIYYCKIWDNGTLVCDFIPCLDSAGKPCLYDLVEKKAYYNQGTGDDFTYGRQIIPVEYLESTGTQYIDTNWVPNANGRVELQGAYTEVGSSYYSTAYYLFAQHGGTNARFNIGQYGSTVTTFSFDITSANRITDYPLDTNKHIFGINAQTKQTFIDANVYENPSVADFGSTTYSSYMFARNISNVAGAFSKAKIYYCKIWDNNTLVRNFIPCKDENNIGFMFDLVTNTIHENAGTGTFLHGEEAYDYKLQTRLFKDNSLPAGYTQVEYLESTGTQYIDTGVIPTSNMEFYTKIRFNSNQNLGGDVSVMASRESTRVQPIFVYSNKWAVGLGNAYDTSGNPVAVDTDYNIHSIVSDGTTIQLYVDDILSSSLTNTTGIPSLPLYFMARNLNGTANAFSKMRAKFLKIHSEGTLVRDYIPAIDPSGVPCMYDRVSKTPFYNQGTGTFTTGKPLLPVTRFLAGGGILSKYTFLNYLESTGEQRIDTGIPFIAQDDYIIKTRAVNFDVAKRSIIISNYYNAGYTALSLEWWAGSASNNGKARGYMQRRSSSGQNVSSPSALSIDIPHDLELHFLKSEDTMSLYYDENVESIVVQEITNPDSLDHNLCLFLDERPSPSAIQNPTRIYYLQIYHKGTLVRNFIPALRKLDSKPGMLDIITMQFFTNVGTGEFLYG